MTSYRGKQVRREADWLQKRNKISARKKQWKINVNSASHHFLRTNSTICHKSTLIYQITNCPRVRSKSETSAHQMPTTCPPHAHHMPTTCPPHAHQMPKCWAFAGQLFNFWTSMNFEQQTIPADIITYKFHLWNSFWQSLRSNRPVPSTPIRTN